FEAKQAEEHRAIERERIAQQQAAEKARLENQQKIEEQRQKQAMRERELAQKAQREAEQKFSNNLSELKQGYETGSLKPQAIIKRYAELLQEYQSNDAKKEIIIIARAEFNIFIASNAANQKQKELLLGGAKKDLEGILETNPYHEKALTLLENIEKLMQESNSPITSMEYQAVSNLNEQASTSNASGSLGAPASHNRIKKTASLESSGMIELNLNIQYTELNFDKKLGQGAYGEVYSGIWRYNQVAIKKLLGTSYNDEAITELQQEAQVLAKVRSDYVVQIKGLAIQSPHYCLVMELMPKGNLYELLQSEQPLGWTQRYQLAQDIGIGLHHLHAENILHRDLKSLNVLLSETGRAKLCDFGLAKIKTTTKTQSRMTQTNAGAEKSVGTLPWMAPELFGLRPKYSTKSDIYAYGIIMWELSARRVPYEDVISEGELRDCIKNGDREEIPDNTPPSYAKLITFCWAQKPEERPEVEKVLEELETCKQQLR
ncbi:MAG: protein kinase, partial [Candidatus Berkiella sp.]